MREAGKEGHRAEERLAASGMRLVAKARGTVTGLAGLLQ